MLDYSRISRHLLVTAGDDGTVHLWDTTGRSPKVGVVSPMRTAEHEYSYPCLLDSVKAGCLHCVLILLKNSCLF